jgi:cytosolic prostaglandin-E synthase
MNTAPVKWAQRKDSLFVTITLPDVKDHKIDVGEKKLTFTGNSNGKPYSVDLEFVSKSLLLSLLSYN